MNDKPQALIDLETELNGEFMPKMIGQSHVKAQIRQRILTFMRTGGSLNPILFVAPRGGGKTHAVRGMAKRLLSSTREKHKEFVEINGATLKSVGAFIDVVGKYLAGPDGGAQEVTIFIDEVHACDVKVRNFLLSFISPNAEGRCRVLHNGQEFEVDYRSLSLIMATTDAQKLTEAFKSRCNVIAMNTYSKSEMKQILDQYLDAMAKRHGLVRPHVTESVEEDLISICRRTPRFAVKYAEDLVNFCANGSVETLDRKGFLKFVKDYDIHPCGLNRNELRVLEALQTNGAMTLNALSACVGLEKSMIQKDCENILHEHGLIVIDGKRSITGKGRTVLAGWE